MSTIKSIFLQHLNGTTPNATMDTNGNFTVGGTVSGASSNMFRNRIINGDMRIDQRNAGASSTPAGSSGGTYTLDRWVYQASQTGKFTVQQNAGSVTPPTGFSSYLGLTSTSSYSVGTSDYFNIYQCIEANNIANLDFGKSTAKSITLSFWVRSSLTGTFGGSFRNGTGNRTYPFTYTISSANTWTYITITISGDTTGTWATDNTQGLYITWSLGVGSTYSGGTVNTWNAGNYQSPSSPTSVVGTSGATFYITGVQFEAGTVATPFEFRHYGTELALCQRYYQVLSNGLPVSYMFGASSTVAVVYTGSLPVPMRASPTLSNSVAVTINDSNANYTQSSASMSINNGSATSLALRTNNFTSLPQDGRAFQIMTASFAGLSAEL